MAGKGRIENLVTLDQRTKEEQREICSMGGKASQKKQRENRTLRETIKMIMELPAQDEKSIQKMKENGIPDNLTNATMVGLALVDRAKNGNIPAQRLLAEMVGENDVQGVPHIPAGAINVNFVDKDGEA
jgi:hypothetical protein